MIKVGDSFKTVPEEKQWLYFKQLGSSSYIQLSVGRCGACHCLMINGFGLMVLKRLNVWPTKLFSKWRINIPFEGGKKLLAIGLN